MHTATVHIRETHGGAEWDAFVAGAPDSTFCHQYGWRHILSEVMRHPCIYLVAEHESGELAGALPLTHVRSPIGSYLVSLPFMSDGGPIGAPQVRRELTSRAVELARSKGVGLLELRSRQVVPSDDIRTSNRKIGVHLDLPDTVEALWASTFKAKLRSQIRRAGKEGMTVRQGPDQLSAFYDVFARNMRDLGTPVLPRRFFTSLLEQFGQRVNVFAVYTSAAVPVAASVCLSWREEVEVTWASSLREYNKLSPNMLLYATMMEHAILQGLRRFNFGRSTPGSATHRFKQQWGGHDVSLPWAEWPVGEGAAVPSGDSSHFAMAIAIWSRLPVGVTKAVGPVLSRWFP